MSLYQWAIYDHPKDYPDKFVVRRWKIEAGVVTPDPECHLADSLLEARLFIPDRLVRTSHMHGDDP